MIFITGGCGFIGSNFSLDWLTLHEEPVIILDKLTYAGNLSNLEKIKNNANFNFIHGDINNIDLIISLLKKYQPRAILNFAAESHVDRSIHNPSHFINTNIQGTFCLLEAARHYWLNLSETEQLLFRFLQVSTDEVYGSLRAHDPAFTEETAYTPTSPYSASKAAADHLVRAYFCTYGLPVLITNCSNNYGPYQFPEKLIPLTILNALQQKPILLYGDGLNIRDWLYVSDHCEAIRKVLADGRVGETYNIGGNSEKTNVEVVQAICGILDDIRPIQNNLLYSSLIKYISDRPGHDRRYAVDTGKIRRDLSWQPRENFTTGMHKTVLWYLNNQQWVDGIATKSNYQQWLNTNYKDNVKKEPMSL